MATNMTQIKIDKTIAEIIALKAQKKELEKVLKEKIALIENMYTEGAKVPERIIGKDYQAEKIPVNRGKNNFNPLVVESYLNVLDNSPYTDIIQTVKVVDADKFNKLVDEGYITPLMADAARLSKWTFSTKFTKTARAVADEAQQLTTDNNIEPTAVVPTVRA